MISFDDVQYFKNLLRDKRWEEAVGDLHGKLVSVQEYMTGLAKNNEQAVLEFGEIMQILVQAIECMDAILLCDIIEYELFPFVNTYITKSEE